ncbi:hypothetical protein [Christensenella tenuis]|uniref:Uncharacterized protein n=1 Tax=Christensenella tenuis TaxID=2763033 RepID=A0ABR7EFW9_9FIRM|nr:hypothetical protein [Christensenella tenuis]MBC5647949.1 hypothetical protein [Christensenella tenuis]
MKGHRFVVGGDPIMARNTVYAALENQGFALTHIDDWSADAERGSSGASVLLGAFAGKKGRHVKLRVTCESSPEGTVITLMQGTSGVSGGLIGVSQASALYSDLYNTVGLTFQNAGVLISGGEL